MADGLKSDHYGDIKVKFKSVTASGMMRARETAEAVGEFVDGVAGVGLSWG